MRIISSVALLVVLISCSHNLRSTSAPETVGGDAVDNPFFEVWNTPLGVPPFARIRGEHFEPAFSRAMASHLEEIRLIAENPEPPTFENTVEAMDFSGQELMRVARVFYGLLGAATDDRLDGLARTISPLLTRHGDGILQNKELFARIKVVYGQRESLGLNREQEVLLEEIHRSFILGGADLDEARKAELASINEELSLLTTRFGQNILKEDNRFELHLTDPADLAGLPQAVVDGAAAAARERGRDQGWSFTLHKPSLIPFLQYSERRELREKMLKGYVERCAHGDELDNRENIRKIIELRNRKAGLLGFANYGELALSRRVAGKPERVFELLHKLWKPALARAGEEAREIQGLIDQDQLGFKLEAWDWWYFAEKVRKLRFNLEETELRPYFQMEKVLDGAFGVANRLYGLTFQLRTDLPVYHPDVRVFEVRDGDGTVLGVLYTDFFPRASKRGGAWCGTYRDPFKPRSGKVTPVVTIVGNFSKPVGDAPALLSLEEVTTLFHEFGHALHVLLNDTTYLTTGDAVRVDFVELPSQIMENWATAAEVLNMYAVHFETGEPMPQDLIERIGKAGTFNQGFGTVEYLAASLLDLTWHTTSLPKDIDPVGFEQETLKALGMPREIEVRYRSPFFRHVFGSDYYAAGYYSYIWAAVLDADAFETFRERGLFDRETARAFREHILSRGGADDQMEMYRRFRGREPDIRPLLERRGLLGN